ncbi:hypothetical protein L1987_03608 [Smallanthus sonchifolius]|uniref:Uncharacterized protein n=1 Tax=Smallanthus sonchifolius TaxID=185202 RepID=A0ACB9KB64_9ASTR|nr:hypothetical protein L1987_03608 [Smallanthus sonchifolius]
MMPLRPLTLTVVSESKVLKEAIGEKQVVGIHMVKKPFAMGKDKFVRDFANLTIKDLWRITAEKLIRKARKIKNRDKEEEVRKSEATEEGDIGESSNQRESMGDNINMFDRVEQRHEDAYFKREKWAMGTYLDNYKDSPNQIDEEFRQQIWDYVVQKTGNPQEELSLQNELRLISVHYLDLLEWYYESMRDKIELNDKEEWELMECKDWEIRKWKMRRVCTIKISHQVVVPQITSIVTKKGIKNPKRKNPRTRSPRRKSLMEKSSMIATTKIWKTSFLSIMIMVELEETKNWIRRLGGILDANLS